MKEYESDIPCALCNEPYGEHRYKDDSCPLFRFSILGHTVYIFSKDKRFSPKTCMNCNDGDCKEDVYGDFCDYERWTLRKDK